MSLTRRSLLLTTTATTLSLPILEALSSAASIENRKSKIENLSDASSDWLSTTLKPTDIPDGGFDTSLARSHKILLARVDKNIFALSNRCTHHGCTVNTPKPGAGGGIQCNCHGARFDTDGSVKKGPAQKPLPRYSLRLSNTGTLEINPTKEISATDPTSTLTIQ